MTQRVSRAERLRRQKTGDRGFVYRRPVVSMTALLKETYPMPGTPARDWPSAATVTVRMMVGHFPLRRPVTLLVRVPKSRSEAEAKARAVSKLRLSVGEMYRICWVDPVVPDGVPAVPSIQALTYRVCPLFGMLKREVVDGQ